MGADYIPVSQVEQGDAADAPPEENNTPVQIVDVEDVVAQLKAQVKWSSMWVNYMLAVQMLASFWFPSLLFIVNLVFNFVGLIGVYRQKRAMISLHFGYTIGLHCIAWFIVFYTMFYATFISILTLVFCLIQSIGLKHERNLLTLLAIAPSALEQISVEYTENNTTPQPEQPAEPQVQAMPAMPAMPSFAYGVYGQQQQQMPGMEQPMYPGMYPGFYPFPQGYFPYPQQSSNQQQQQPMPVFPGYPFPPQGFAFAPMPVPQSVDIPVTEDNKQ